MYITYISSSDDYILFLFPEQQLMVTVFLVTVQQNESNSPPVHIHHLLMYLLKICTFSISFNLKFDLSTHLSRECVKAKMQWS